ncbi:MAG: DUF2508 family protein [Clostridia bacterium]|nr:DUF2508 family protein [Clostridia bacterium]
MGKYSHNENLASEEMKAELLGELERAILDLNVALENYNSAAPELVDYYSYQIKAMQAKYDYLLKLTKDMNLSKFKKII